MKLNGRLDRIEKQIPPDPAPIDYEAICQKIIDDCLAVITAVESGLIYDRVQPGGGILICVNDGYREFEKTGQHASKFEMLPECMEAWQVLFAMISRVRKLCKKHPATCAELTAGARAVHDWVCDAMGGGQ